MTLKGTLDKTLIKSTFAKTLRRSRRARKRLCFFGACVAFCGIFFWSSHSKIVKKKQNEKIQANTTKDMVIMGKTAKGNPYVIRALHGKQIAEQKFFFEMLTCTIWGKEVSTLSSNKGTLDLAQKQLFLEGDVVFSPLKGVWLTTEEGYLSYALERAWGNKGIVGTRSHAGYQTHVRAEAFEANQACIMFRGKVVMRTYISSVL